MSCYCMSLLEQTAAVLCWQNSARTNRVQQTCSVLLPSRPQTLTDAGVPPANWESAQVGVPGASQANANTTTSRAQCGKYCWAAGGAEPHVNTGDPENLKANLRGSIRYCKYSIVKILYTIIFAKCCLCVCGCLRACVLVLSCMLR